MWHLAECKRKGGGRMKRWKGVFMRSIQDSLVRFHFERRGCSSC